MNKKLILTGLTCVFLLISGICYSCAYEQKQPVLISSMTDEAKGGVETEQNEEQKNSENALKEQSSTELTDQRVTEIIAENVTNIYVHICGAVVHPGVYQVDAGARIVDLIELSGGLTKEAAGDFINQAIEVTDGQRIYVPSQEELKDLPPLEYQAGVENEIVTAGNSVLININTADAEELMSLPGIGEAKADSIISFRKSNGIFKNVEDLMNIPGIKEGLFNQIVSKITVD